jgi:hypothetical protein
VQEGCQDRERGRDRRVASLELGFLLRPDRVQVLVGLDRTREHRADGLRRHGLPVQLDGRRDVLRDSGAGRLEADDVGCSIRRVDRRVEIVDLDGLRKALRA